MNDPLDDLLDRSAPRVAERAGAGPSAMAQIVRDAAATVRPSRRSRRRDTVLAGLGAVLLVGTAGVATANSDWLWGSGLENPDRSYSYSSPTWGECEIRYSDLDTHNPLIQGEVDRIIDEWFATTDVEAAAEPFVAKYLAVLRESRGSDPASLEDPRLPDLEAWTAHDQAFGEALSNELAAHGYDGEHGLADTEQHSQVHCEREDWGGSGDGR